MMNDLCKRLALSSLNIALISQLSCAPDEPAVQGGEVEVIASGKYLLINRDGTLAFERDIDDLCEAHGRIAEVRFGDENYTELYIIIVCFDSEGSRDNFSKKDIQNPLGFSIRQVDVSEGAFYFKGLKITEDIYSENKGIERLDNGSIFYDSYDFALQYGTDLGRIGFDVDYQISDLDRKCDDVCNVAIKISSKYTPNTVGFNADMTLKVLGIERR